MKQHCYVYRKVDCLVLMTVVLIRCQIWLRLVMVTVAAAHVTSTAGYCPGVGLHYTVTFTSNNQYYYKIQFIEYNFLNIHNDTDM